jgi:hypothetical protein
MLLLIPVTYPLPVGLLQRVSLWRGERPALKSFSVLLVMIMTTMTHMIMKTLNVLLNRGLKAHPKRSHVRKNLFTMTRP